MVAMNSSATWTCMSIGVAIGVAWWLLFDNVAFMGVGIALGIAIGVGIDQRKGRDRDE